MENNDIKICPFNMKPCIEENCVFFDEGIAKCEFKGMADYIVDHLVEVRDTIIELQGGDND